MTTDSTFKQKLVLPALPLLHLSDASKYKSHFDQLWQEQLQV